VYRRLVWRRFVEETFCRGDVVYVRLLGMNERLAKQAIQDGDDPLRTIAVEPTNSSVLQLRQFCLMRSAMTCPHGRPHSSSLYERAACHKTRIIQYHRI
jgi:hypothetical protein